MATKSTTTAPLATTASPVESRIQKVFGKSVDKMTAAEVARLSELLDTTVCYLHAGGGCHPKTFAKGEGRILTNNRVACEHHARLTRILEADAVFVHGMEIANQVKQAADNFARIAAEEQRLTKHIRADIRAWLALENTVEINEVEDSNIDDVIRGLKPGAMAKAMEVIKQATKEESLKTAVVTETSASRGAGTRERIEARFKGGNMPWPTVVNGSGRTAKP